MALCSTLLQGQIILNIYGLFTLRKKINFQLGSLDFVRQTFTMEAFTLWSPTFSLDSISMEAPSRKGACLRLETFTLCFHAMVNSFACFPQMGVAAPCTNTVHKAAHRSETSHSFTSAEWTMDNRKSALLRFFFSFVRRRYLSIDNFVKDLESL